MIYNIYNLLALEFNECYPARRHEMKLNERKLNILKAIVKDYIETAEAVGSRTISKNMI